MLASHSLGPLGITVTQGLCIVWPHERPLVAYSIPHEAPTPEDLYTGWLPFIPPGKWDHISLRHSSPSYLGILSEDMLFSLLALSGLLPVLLQRDWLASAAPTQQDPCAKIAGLQFVDPADALACQKSFPFDEALRQNVLSVVSRVFDFYTFEDFYLNSPAPFQESTTDIRAQLSRINTTKYAVSTPLHAAQRFRSLVSLPKTDYDFNKDLWDFTNQLNDGHTRAPFSPPPYMFAHVLGLLTGWFPSCYTTYQNILPAPIVLLDEGVFISPDSATLFDPFGPDFANYYKAKGFDWKRLAGAKVVRIGEYSARDYIDKVARTDSGGFLDHNVRVNSAVSSYQMISGNFSQRLGDVATNQFLKQTSRRFSLIPKDSPSGLPERVFVPFVTIFGGAPFSDGPS